MSIFVFGRKWNFVFVGILFMAENENAFRSASSIHYKKVLILVLNARPRLGLGLGLERILKSWPWS